MPTNRIERWIFKAKIKIKESIEQNKQNTQRNTYAIQHFFQRIIPAHIPNIQPHPRPQAPEPPILRHNFISQAITSFFQRNQRPPELDPYIPEHPNDYLPP
jgi:hypothetical protein